MRHEPSLLLLTPPRQRPMPVAEQVQLVAALSTSRRTTARGIALELAGADGHVRFLARAATPRARDHLASFVAGYYPQGAVRPLDDPADDPARLRPGEAALACELRLRTDSRLPIRCLLDDRDPLQLLRIVGVLRELPPGTRGVAQLILWPGPRHWWRDTQAFLRAEREKRQYRQAEPAGHLPAALLGLALAGAAAYTGYHDYQLHDLHDLAQLALSCAGAAGLVLARATVWRSDPPPDPALVQRKAATPAFVARLRVLLVGGSAEQRAERMEALVGAYGAYEDPQANGFVARRCAPGRVADLTMAGAPRLWRRPPMTLSAEEVAVLFNLPPATVDVPGLARGGATVLLPAAGAVTEGIPFGAASLGRHSEPVCLPRALYDHNTIILGGTGMGKSTAAQHCARDAIARAGVQLVVLDPDGDLVMDIAGWLPDAHKRRALLIDFGHPTHKVGLNLLDARTARNHDQVVESLLAAWKRYYDEAWGPRLEDLARAAFLTLLRANAAKPPAEQYTILDVKHLLQNAPFRAQVVREAGSVSLAHYWEVDYMEMPRTERLNARKPIETRVNRLGEHEETCPIVCQSESTLDLPALLASGRILLFNINKEKLGNETAALIYAFLANILNDAVCERAGPREEKPQVVFIADEFADAPGLWEKYLERIRKRGGSWCLLAQGVATINGVRRDLAKVVFQNTGTKIVFRTEEYDEATYLAGLLEQAVTPVDLQTLRVRECYIKTSDGVGTLPITTAQLPPPPRSHRATARLIAEACARRYGRPRDQVMAAHRAWTQGLLEAKRSERRRPGEGDADLAGRAGDAGDAGAGANDGASAPAPDGAAPDGAPSGTGTETAPGGVSDEDAGTASVAPPGPAPVLGLSVVRRSAMDAALARAWPRREGAAGQSPSGLVARPHSRPSWCAWSGRGQRRLRSRRRPRRPSRRRDDAHAGTTGRRDCPRPPHDAPMTRRRRAPRAPRAQAPRRPAV